MDFDHRWLAKTLTQLSAYFYSWQTLLISIHCSQKTFHFLSVSNSPTAIFLRYYNNPAEITDNPTEITRNHFRGVFLKNHKYFQEMFLRRLRDVTEKTYFLRCFSDVLKTSRKSHLFWDAHNRPLRCCSQWRSDWDFSKTSLVGWVKTVRRCFLS